MNDMMIYTVITVRIIKDVTNLCEEGNSKWGSRIHCQKKALLVNLNL